MEQTQEVVLPKVEFIDDVAKFMQGRSVEVVLSSFTDSRTKYKQLEGVLMQRKARLLGKLPEIQKALDIVQVLLDKQSDDKSLIIDYELAESVYAKTKVSKVRTVNLWLGADIMVEYTLEEAKELLETNLENCKTNLKTLDSDLEIVRNSVIILDVTISRIWNWDVELRKEAKEAGTSSSA